MYIVRCPDSIPRKDWGEREREQKGMRETLPYYGQVKSTVLPSFRLSLY